jgi:hypothetical protein
MSMKYLFKILLTYTKMHGASASHALLPKLRMHASLSRVVLTKYYEDSVLFGAFTGFL